MTKRKKAAKAKAPKWLYVDPDTTCIAHCESHRGMRTIRVNGQPISEKRARKLSLWFEKAARWSDADN